MRKPFDARHLIRKPLHAAVIGGLVAAGAPALAQADGAANPTAQARYLLLAAACNPCNPCNPCAAKNACNPCNPCAAKNACNPCNPCAAKNACNPCNPCAAKKKRNPCNPCNPCAAKKS